MVDRKKKVWDLLFQEEDHLKKDSLGNDRKIGLRREGEITGSLKNPENEMAGALGAAT